MTEALALSIIRFVTGAVVTAHGAQKVFGAFGGPGMRAWTGHVAALGFAPAGFFAWAAALVELVGGIAFALGVLTPVAAALIAMNMLVAIVKVHWRNGLFAAKGGIELPLVLGLVAAGLGVATPTVASVDAALGLGETWPLFITTLAVALATVVAGMLIGLPVARTRARTA